jgi:tetratricopeptide (TPR) repeat protein
MQEAVAQSNSLKLVSGISLGLAGLGEAHLLSGNVERAALVAERALRLALDHGERGNATYARRLIAEVAAARDNPEAETSYREALEAATELGMRPLMAHCHRGLGRMLRRQGRPAEAEVHEDQAAALYDALDMTSWAAALRADRATSG